MQVMRFQISLSHFLWCAKFFDAFLTSKTEVLINFFSTFREWLMWDAFGFSRSKSWAVSRNLTRNSLRWNFLNVNSHLLWWTVINFSAFLRFNLFFLMTMMTYSYVWWKESCVVRILITRQWKIILLELCVFSLHNARILTSELKLHNC